MPERAFVTQNLAQLTATIALLDQARQGGSLEELRVAGVLTRRGPMSQTEIDLRYKQARYEAYLRVKDLDATDPSNAAQIALWTNPYKEKIMRVESVHGCYPSHFPTSCQ